GELAADGVEGKAALVEVGKIQLQAPYQRIEIEGAQQARRARLDVDEAATVDGHVDVTAGLLQRERQRRTGPVQLADETGLPTDDVGIVSPLGHHGGQIACREHTVETAGVFAGDIAPVHGSATVLDRPGDARRG